MAHPAPSITIATVCRNPGPALLRTLQSVREQAGVHLEHWIVDGASTDETRELLENLPDPRTFVVSEPDAGIYDAMNKAVRLAQGKWILFLNAGDTFTGPDSVATLALHAKDGVDHVAAGLLLLWPDGKIEPAAPRGVGNLPILETPAFHPATLSRRARLLKHPFDTSFQIAGDMDFFLGEITRGARFIFIPDLVSKFGLDGISSTRRWMTYLESRRTILRHAHLSMGDRVIAECRMLKNYLLGALFLVAGRMSLFPKKPSVRT